VGGFRALEKTLFSPVRPDPERPWALMSEKSSGKSGRAV
jgi:hypothetical protein